MSIYNLMFMYMKLILVELGLHIFILMCINLSVLFPPYKCISLLEWGQSAFNIIIYDGVVYADYVIV